MLNFQADTYDFNVNFMMVPSEKCSFVKIVWGLLDVVISRAIESEQLSIGRRPDSS